MGPIRGLKRRKKTETKKLDQNVFAVSVSSQPESLDWWDEFSQRITGNKFLFWFLLPCYGLICVIGLCFCNFVISIGFGSEMRYVF